MRARTRRALFGSLLQHEGGCGLELWDLYDAQRRPLGRTHRRGEPMPAGEYHVVVAVWTVNGRGEALLTLRDPKKESYPGMWENTAGSAVAGEGSAEGAARELREETGILVPPGELTLLGTRRERSAFADTYIVRRDVPREELRLLPGETVDARWVTLPLLDAMMTRGLVAAPVCARLAAVRDAFEAFLNNSGT